MAFLETNYQKKSFVITTILYVLIILFLFFVGLKYLDPPPESGIAINFGTTEMGSGDVQPTQPIKTAPKQNVPEPIPQQPSTTPDKVEEDVATQETEEAPVIEEKKEVKKPKETPKVEKQDKVQKEEVTKPPVKTPEEKVPEKEPDPQPDQSAMDAMNSLLAGKQQDGQEAKGEGNDKSPGDKGDPKGDPNAKSYYGSGTGIDGDGNYQLGGRKALAKTKYEQDCNESGVVVVRIEVNQDGKVTRADGGAKGTTNASKCLLEPAERAARNTLFNKDSNAPARQVGYIVYDFRLSE